jgi:hypothetical protein
VNTAGQSARGGRSGSGLRSEADSLAAVGENQCRKDRDVKYDEHHVHPDTPLFNALHSY